MSLVWLYKVEILATDLSCSKLYISKTSSNKVNFYYLLNFLHVLYFPFLLVSTATDDNKINAVENNVIEI